MYTKWTFPVKIFVLSLSMLIIHHIEAQNVPKWAATEVSTNHYKAFFNYRPTIDDVSPVSYNDTICYYIITFQDSGWCVVSADYSLEPILAFGNSFWNNEDTVSAFRILLQWYESQILGVKRDGSSRMENQRWRQLLSEPLSTRITYDYGLLDNTGRKNNLWGQYSNNNTILGYGTECEPTYNANCPEDHWYNTQCDCGHYPVGCGAVAFGQLQWYWKWPKNIDWENIPGKLDITTPTIKSETLTRYLRDCGEDVNMTYMCMGSWTTMNNILDAFQNNLYRGVKKYSMDEWSYGSSWKNLIKSEIDSRRPVLMYGESFTFVTGHYFVVDDYYEESGETWFHVNWGHRNTCNGYCKIDRLHEGEDYYNINNSAIVGISPTYEDYDIISLPYNIIPSGETRKEYACHNIVIPNGGLVVQNGGSFSAECGNKIILRPGFQACAGSSVSLQIKESWRNNMNITVPSWINVYDPLSEGDYCLKVFNADSWEFSLYDMSNVCIYKNAGSVHDTIACMWNGTIESGWYYCPYGTYTCSIVFKNSFGRRIENTFILVLQPHNYLLGDMEDSSILRASHSQLDLPVETEDDKLVVYPNPTSGVVNFEATDDTIIKVMIYDPMGSCRYLDSNIGNPRYSANLIGLQKDTYIVIIVGIKAIYRRKIALN